jgi:agmatinase
MKSVPHDFFDMDDSFRDPERAAVQIIPVPYDRMASWQTNSSLGPAAIIRASHQLEEADPETGLEVWREGIATLPSIETQGLAPEQVAAAIRERVGAVLDQGRWPLLFGGDHSISSGAVAAALQRFPGLTFLHFDAHGDLREEYCGSIYSHASVARRALEMGARIVQVGIRSQTPEEVALAKEGKVTVFPMPGLWTDDDVLAAVKGPVYLSFDLDAFDPSIMPAVSTPVPGGLPWYPTLTLLRKVFSHCTVVAADIVELSPINGMEYPETTAAHLAYKMMTYRMLGRRRGDA